MVANGGSPVEEFGTKMHPNNIQPNESSSSSSGKKKLPPISIRDLIMDIVMFLAVSIGHILRVSVIQLSI